MLKYVLAAATFLVVPALAAPAAAAPFVDIRAAWGATPTEWAPLPEGLTFGCWGDASAGPGGCGRSLTLSDTVTTSGTSGASALGGVVITNTSGQTVNGFAVINVWFSAFNPGGPEVGLGIDDPSTQWAAFTSNVSGDVSDAHACAVGYRGSYGTQFSATTCGVAAPDFSQLDLYADFTDFMPGDELRFTFGLDIGAVFDLDGAPARVPAPGSAVLLMGFGLAGLGLRRRRAIRAL